MTVARPTVLFVCTGNAARSVMAAALLRSLTDKVDIESAGTHSIPGLPMSTRTRSALEGLDVRDPHHRSAQLDDDHTDRATLIAVFEPMHVRYVRENHPMSADRVASLPRLARDLAPGTVADLADRITALDLAAHAFEPWEEIVDPAGGELVDFEAAARHIDRLIRQIQPKIGA
jgi:protein-tyrosine-phosphatase